MEPVSTAWGCWAMTAAAPPVWSLSRWLSMSMSRRTPSARSSGTSTRPPASLSGPKRGPVSYSRLCVAVRTSTALPWPTSAASSSNCPGTGRGDCHSNTGTNNGTPKARTGQGNRKASSAPPNTPATPAHSGAAGSHSAAPGQEASHCSTATSGCTAAPASCHSGAHRVPSKASGVTTRVTQGMARRLATNPTSDTCPNSKSPRGVSASVTTHCSRNNA